MARFRFARDTIVNSFTTAAMNVVNSRAELLAHIQRNIVYLRDLTEPNPLIIPPPPGARLVVSPDEPLYRPDPDRPFTALDPATMPWPASANTFGMRR